MRSVGELRRENSRLRADVEAGQADLSVRLDDCEAASSRRDQSGGAESDSGQTTSDRRNLQSQGPKAKGDIARIWRVHLDDGAGTPGGRQGGSKGGGKRRGRRMQQTGQCDDTTLESQTQAVNTACSDGATAGVPTSCSPECAAVLVPLWQNCRVELGPTANFLKDLVKTCPSLEAQSPPTGPGGGATSAVHMMMVTCPVGAETSDCIPQCNAERQGDELLLNMRGNDMKWTCEERSRARALPCTNRV